MRRVQTTPIAHLNILTGLLSVSSYVVVAKLFGAAKEVAVAARYGTNPAVDAYVYIFGLISWPLSVWTSALAVVLVPLLIRAAKQQPDELHIFQREFFGASLLAGAALAMISVIFFEVCLHFSLLGISPVVAVFVRQMVIPISCILPLGYASTLFATQLIASRRHTNSLFEGIPALFLLLVVVLIPANDGWSLSFGTLLGFLVQLIILVYLRPRGDHLGSISFRFTSPLWKELRRYSSLVIISQIMLGLTGVIDQIMIGHLGPTANATMGYASRLLALLTSLGAMAIGRAILPVLSDAASLGDRTDSSITRRWVGIFFAIGIILAGIGWVLADTVVNLIFERGAFTADDTARVADIFRFSLLQLPFYMPGIVIVQLIASRTDYRSFLYVNMIGLVVKVAGNLLLMPSMGINGALLATAGMYACTSCSLWIFARR